MKKSRKKVKKKTNKKTLIKNTKKTLIISMILLILLLSLFGVTYSMLNYRKTSANQQLIIGDIYMHYNEGENRINILDMMPRSNYDESKYFEFTINGKNTNKRGNVIYNIQITKENVDKLWTLHGTANSLYLQERSNILCSNSITTNSHDANCNIWNGNPATWEGKIGILYPSDFAYASKTSNWTKDVNLYHTNGGSYNNWMFNTGAGAIWFLSPTSKDSTGATRVSYGGNLGDGGVYFLSAIRPVLNLKSDVIVLSGDGSYNSPYKLLEN